MTQHRELGAILEVVNEQLRQLEMWGAQHHPDYTNYTLLPSCPEVYLIPTTRAARNFCERKAQSGKLSWSDILIEEVLEVLDEAKAGNVKELREELIQVAAVCCSWVDAIDGRTC